MKRRSSTTTEELASAPVPPVPCFFFTWSNLSYACTSSECTLASHAIALSLASFADPPHACICDLQLRHEELRLGTALNLGEVELSPWAAIPPHRGVHAPSSTISKVPSHQRCPWRWARWCSGQRDAAGLQRSRLSSSSGRGSDAYLAGRWCRRCGGDAENIVQPSKVM
jgi:hypothetical protein